MLRKIVERSWRAWVREGNVNKRHPLYGPLPPRRRSGRSDAGALGLAWLLASLGGAPR